MLIVHPCRPPSLLEWDEKAIIQIKNNEKAIAKTPMLGVGSSDKATH